MKTYIKLAWRNIWRNKRRTFITSASIFLAIILAVFMRAFQVGTFNNMIKNIVQAYTGYIQVHRNGYWNEKDINNSFECNDSLLKVFSSSENVSFAVPRLESFALASYEQQSKGVAVIGIVPEKEDELTNISKKIVEGSMLKNNDDGVMVSQKLAKFLNIKTGDTLVLIGQGYHGASAAGKFPVRSIMHFPSPELDNRMIYMNLNKCQELYSAENMLTSVSFNLKEPDKIDQTASFISKKLNNEKYEVMTWDEMLVELVQHIKTDTISSYIFLGILYMIIGFGIFGTVIMMTTERIKEFGVMISVGMQKIKLSLIVALEMFFLGILGIISGVIAITPVILYFSNNPIKLGGDYAKTMESFGIEPLFCVAFQPDIYIAHSLIVLFIVLLAIIYPFNKIIRLKIINALRNK